MTAKELPRFFAKVDIATADGCWLWTAATGSGYGKFWSLKSDGGRKLFQAHRLSYEHFVGSIPEGLQLDHLCRVRNCVNPAHLEPVTNHENSRRGAKGDLVTVCVQGHPYDEANTGWKTDPVRGRRRHCRACAREKMRRKRAAGYIAPCRR